MSSNGVPDGFWMHPRRVRFSSPSAHYQRVHVHGFGADGTIAENCIAKGVAEVAGTGLRGTTMIADVFPEAPGHCEATFTNGHGAKLRLPIVVSQ